MHVDRMQVLIVADSMEVDSMHVDNTQADSSKLI